MPLADLRSRGATTLLPRRQRRQFAPGNYFLAFDMAKTFSIRLSDWHYYDDRVPTP